MAVSGGDFARSFSAATIRKILQRSREQFAKCLLDEVAQALGSNDRGRLEQEVIDLGLHAYCKSALT